MMMIWKQISTKNVLRNDKMEMGRLVHHGIAPPHTALYVQQFWPRIKWLQTPSPLLCRPHLLQLLVPKDEYEDQSKGN
jgi:hypothetical protein